MTRDADRYLWNPQDPGGDHAAGGDDAPAGDERVTDAARDDDTDDDASVDDLRALEAALQPARWRPRGAPDVSAAGDEPTDEDPDVAWERARQRRAALDGSATSPASAESVDDESTSLPAASTDAPEQDASGDLESPFGRPPPRWLALLVAAAAVLVFLSDGLGWFDTAPVVPRRDVAPRTARGLSFEVLQGAVVVDPGVDPARSHDLPGRRFGLAAGDVLVCDAEAQALLAVGSIGSVDVRPGSRLSVIAAGGQGSGAWSLFLERGELSAAIFAPPGLFHVGTPAGLAVDLGCRYVAHVDADGLTRLRVEGGLVSFAALGREVLVPEGATLLARPGRRPGTPIWAGIAVDLQAAVERLDALADGWENRASAETDGLDEAARLALERILAEPGVPHVLTLWHLGDHPSPTVRDAVLSAAAQRKRPPEGVDPLAVSAGDADQRARWLSALRLNWR